MDTINNLAFRMFGPSVSGPVLLIGIGIVVLLAILALLLVGQQRRRKSSEEDEILSPQQWLKLRNQPRKAPLTLTSNHDPHADPFVQGNQQERRGGGYRRRGNPIAIQFIDSEDAEPESGWIVDRSTGGLGLELARAVAVETVLTIRPTDAGITTPCVDVVVRNCRLDGAHYQVGTQFVRTPSWDVMLAFG